MLQDILNPQQESLPIQGKPIPARSPGWISHQADSFANANAIVCDTRSTTGTKLGLRESVLRGSATASSRHWRGSIELMGWSEVGVKSFVFAPAEKSASGWLDEALQDLAECSVLAQEDDLAEPSDLAIAKAKELLMAASARVQDRPDVYPMQEGCIAVDFRHPEHPWGVMFAVEQDGSGVSHYKIEKSRGQCIVGDAADLLGEGGWELLRRSGVLQ